MIHHYYYNQQLKKAIVAFSNIFAGLKVRTGMDECGVIHEIEVPIRYGSSDRVVAALSAGDTQNKLFTLPIMTSYMLGLELAPDRLHGVNMTDRKKYMEQGDTFPTDIKVLKRLMPIPYNLSMELAIYASNTDQMFQILEQILLLFDYNMQLQINDAPFDWARQLSITLVSITNEENYPAGVENRAVKWTLSFEMPIWLSPPMEIRDKVIQTIILRIGDLEDYTLNEIDQNGELVPFIKTWAEMTVQAPVETPDEPDTLNAVPGGQPPPSPHI